MTNSNGNISPNVILGSVSAHSAYECCVACIRVNTCASSLYFSEGCLLLSYGDGRTCSQQGNVAASLYTQSDPDATFVSNGYCGTVVVT